MENDSYLIRRFTRTRHRKVIFLFWIAISFPAALCARRPSEPGDGSPVPPCTNIGAAAADIKLEVHGLPLRGCTVDIVAGGSRI